MVRIGIFGGSGYTGQELLRLLIRHPGVEPVAVTSRQYKGMHLSKIYPVFLGETDLAFIDAEPAALAETCDLIFLAVPHGKAMEAVPQFLSAGKKVIDLSADYRIRDRALFEEWYCPHSSPDLLAEAVYGLPELHRKAIAQARLVANPGCYPTSAILGLAPLLRQDAIDKASIIIDSKSGTSGAGRDIKLDSLFCEVNEGFKAYKIGTHRHRPEIEQELSMLAGSEIRVIFTPHLLPVNRGILTTIYATLSSPRSTEEIRSFFDDFYRNEPFVRLCPAGCFPNISSVRGSNNCHIGCTVDERTGRVVILSAIDNLVKGAAGQAVQNMNILCGFDERAGLGGISLNP
ncbi:MAG: N-acetyl-gamma-glutamyl-phosphate reductase [Deltaproteobacteria bacterium]|nr:N-acetyl-gamma-glutamyl-phosphate reductase [Deltaproteobacteria bacterium]